MEIDLFNHSSLWSKGSDSGSKASYLHQPPRCLSPWDAGLEFPTEKHPCHPLPLPPSSPNGPPKKSPSKWKKGKLIGRGTYGHVYAGFNSENGTMCAVKEVKVITDDQTSKECLKQLNQVCLVFFTDNILNTNFQTLSNTMGVNWDQTSFRFIWNLFQGAQSTNYSVNTDHSRNLLFEVTRGRYSVD
ncbi:hypothetical protein HRI_004313100 [Hibiscus trionum]|uniref:mitogen-activated protein kinase kinase kinase n=1 Tax=Hibiscus trionum TaxID=183268 RepID=A0A9W7J3Z3_HIBTR|nr:hypothetical protein HRI_004313100 [Hibiscus trionum]